MKPETEIRNLKRELKEIKQEHGRLVISNRALERDKKLLTEDRDEWKNRFDILLNKLQAAKVVYSEDT